MACRQSPSSSQTLLTDQLTSQHKLEVYSKLAENPHPNLRKLLTHHHVANTACLIFESALMDLREFMSAGQLSPAMVPTASLHMAQGVSFLHSHHIIHRDLKPNNFLVHITFSGPVFQIADFGTATISSCPQAQGKLAEMTPGFAQTPAICFISGRQVMVFLTHRGLRAPQLCSPGPLPATDHRSHSSYPVCANPTQSNLTS